MRGWGAVLTAALLSLPAALRAEVSGFDGNGSLGAAAPTQAVPDVGGGVPAVGGGPLPPQAMPATGHNTGFHPSQYNIWSTNCHTEANFFTAVAHAQGIPAGTLACQGNPESSPQFHTANWAVSQDGQACIYNWGRPCCWSAGGASPDISSGQGQACAQWACGDQYDPAHTRLLAAGQLVESPGPLACTVGAAGGPPTLLPGMALTAIAQRVRSGDETVQVPAYPSLPNGAVLTFTPDRLASCMQCCGDRASMWSGNKAASVTPTLAQGRERQFRTQCQTACRNSFSAPSGQN